MIRKLLLAIVAPLALLILCEGALRLLGRPHGSFAGTEYSVGLWGPNQSLDLRFGPIRYRVETNSLGLRGPELRPVDDPALWRIAAVGDSMTDGFFVDDDATYPSLLQATLKRRGVDAEVLNLARGGGSIDLFLERLERYGAQLAPRIVIVSFVTNDLHELQASVAEPGLATRLGSALVTRSALGELLMEAQLRLRGTDERDEVVLFEGLELSGDARYRVPGAGRHAQNAADFLRRFHKVDGELLVDPLPPDVLDRLEAEYLPRLERFRDRCSAMGAALLFVYFPAYPQLYLAGAPTAIQDRLEEATRDLGIPFLDLSDSLRRAGAKQPIHLAPLDYHLNPRGNRAVAEAIADALIFEALLGPSPH